MTVKQRPLAYLAVRTQDDREGHGDMNRHRRLLLAAPRARRLGLTSTLALCVVAFLLALSLAPAAGAKSVYVWTGEFGASGSGNGEFAKPSRIAVDPTTGDVFVADTANSRVQVFSPTATGATYLTQFGAGELSAPRGIAVDPTTGAVYVGDSGLNQIVKFDQTPGIPPTFAKDGTFSTPAHGTGAEEIGTFGELPNNFLGAVFGGIAVDPTPGGLAADSTTGTHDILVADPVNQRTERFDSKGAFITSFNGFSCCSPIVPGFTKPSDVAVNSAGDVIVADIVEIAGETTSSILRYTGAGAYEATLGPVPNVATGFGGVAIAADTGTNQAFVSSKAGSLFSSVSQIYRFSGPAATPPDSEIDNFGVPAGNTGFNGLFFGMAARPASGAIKARLYVIAGFAALSVPPLVQVFEELTFPDVTTGQASNQTTTSATLNGNVNPDGVQLTDCHFEYVPQSQFEVDEFKSVTAAEKALCVPSAASIPPDSSDHAVSADVTGLEPGTVYHFRLVAGNANGPSFGSGQTLATGPGIEGESLSDVGSTYATLHAQINPHGSGTTYRFEYGADTSYGTSVPVPNADIGSGGSDVAVSRTIEGLQPSTTYHWRVVATANALGTTYGSDQTLLTYPPAPLALPDRRAYELVTPSNKLGQDVFISATNLAVTVSPNGQRVVYLVESAGVFGDATSAEQGEYMAARTPGGWVSTFVSLPVAEHPDFQEARTPVGGSQDFSTLFYEALQGISPNDQNKSLDVYAREPGGSFAWISQGDGGVETAKVPSEYVGSSADGSHALFETEQALTPSDSAQVAGQALYERASGTTSLVGVKSDGSLTSACGAVAGSGEASNGKTIANAISSDGSRVFFESPDPHGSGDPSCSSGHQLYLRENGTTTTEVSLSQKTGSVGTPGGGEFVGASANGSRVFFLSGNQLTNDPAASSGGLYMYDVKSGVLTFIAKGRPLIPGGSAIPAISEDASHVYFTGEAPGGPSGQAGLYLWDEGQISYISPAPVNTGSGSLEAQASADGSTLAFTSTSDLTSFKGLGYEEVYVYRAGEGPPVCVSCDPNGIPPTGPAHLALHAGRLAQSTNRAVTSDGSMVFFQSPNPLLPQATNGLMNVYEYEHGTLHLLSDGNGPYATRLVGTSADGSDVIVGTRDSLVPQDQNGSGSDLYDVRIGGGFPTAGAQAQCSGEGCQGSPGATPLLPSSLSATQAGGDNLAAAPASKPKSLTNAQKLSKALKACRRKPKSKRAACKAQARRRYRAKSKAGKSAKGRK